MTLFAELEKRTSAAIDRLHGELTRIDPQRAGQVFAGSADGTRPQVSAVGIIDFSPVTVTAQDEGTYDGFQPQLIGDKIHVSYAESAFPDASTWPKQGDVIVALERPGMPKFRLSRAPDHDGIGRFICVCVPA